MSADSSERVMAIVGAGHVGGRAAQMLRESGGQGRIAMIGVETHLPYERPPLSKQLLTGEREVPHCQLRAHDAWVADRIEHVVAKVERIVPDAREVVLADGRVIAYEALLLATGGLMCEGSPFPAPISTACSPCARWTMPPASRRGSCPMRVC